MDVIRIKFENLKEIMTNPNKNNTMVSKHAYEDCIHTIKGLPIIYNDNPIGVMENEHEGFLFLDCLPEIVAKEMHTEGEVCVVDSFYFSSINVGRIRDKEEQI